MSNEAAKQLGKLGGNKTKERGSDYYRQIGAKGKATRYKAKRDLKAGEVVTASDVEQLPIPRTQTKPQKLKVCKHGILLNVGKCKFGCQ